MDGKLGNDVCQQQVVVVLGGRVLNRREEHRSQPLTPFMVSSPVPRLASRSKHSLSICNSTQNSGGATVYVEISWLINFHKLVYKIKFHKLISLQNKNHENLLETGLRTRHAMYSQKLKT